LITVEVRDSLGADEAAELVAMFAEAADYDAEAGFSTAALAEPDAAEENLIVVQAIARLNPGLHGSTATPIVAFLRLDIDRAGGAEAQLLVHREYRSLGVGTLVVELLAQRPGPGFAGTGAVRIACWARGAHPAAERMAQRLGAEVERSRWLLLRGPESIYVDPEDSAAVRAARRDGYVHEHTDVCYVWRVPSEPGRRRR